jgi:hypothetical protein
MRHGRVRAWSRLVLASASLLICSKASGAQYPLLPSPRLDPDAVPREPRLSGYLSFRETIRRDSATFTINQARLTATVAPADFALVKLQGNLAALGRTSGDTVPGFVLTDAYVQLSPPNGLPFLGDVHPAVTVGQFKTPFSLEYLTGFSVLQTANRSQVVERLATRRDIGIVAHLAFRDDITLAGGVLNGEGANTLRNTNGRQLVLGRLTLVPTTGLAVAGKWAGEGGDHRWGYDARWMKKGLVLEGERIERDAPVTGDVTQDAAGHYVLASYQLTRHLQPVVKWEQFRERLVDAGVASEMRLTWMTYGLNVMSASRAARLQIDWTVKRERPIPSPNELVAQLIVIF